MQGALGRLAGASAAPLAVGLAGMHGDTRCAAAPASAVEDRFEIGSVTKAMTGTLLGILAESGDIDPDAPVDEVTGRPLPWPTRPPTLAELASHRGGLPNTPAGLWWREAVTALGWSVQDPWRGVDAQRYSDMLAQAARRARVGGKVRYSSMGVGLLGEALATSQGLGLEALMHARLLKPLGLSRTGMGRPAHGPDRVAMGINRRGRPVPYLQDHMPAAGAMASTVGDLLRFLRASWGEGPDAVVKGMRRAQQPIAQLGGVQLGYCWFIAPGDRGPMAFHTGGTWASQCEVVVSPQRGLALAVLSACRRDIDGFVDSVVQ